MRLPFASVMTPREVSRHASRWVVKLGVVLLISWFNLTALRKPVAVAGAESPEDSDAPEAARDSVILRSETH